LRCWGGRPREAGGARGFHRGFHLPPLLGEAAAGGGGEGRGEGGGEEGEEVEVEREVMMVEFVASGDEESRCHSVCIGGAFFSQI
jgi:hypothetical protein